MQKEVLTTQTIDVETLKKAKKAVLFSVKPKLWMLYIGIISLVAVINIYTSSDNEQPFYEDNNTDTYTETDPDIWVDVIIALIPVIAFVVIFIVLMRVFRKMNSKELIKTRARYFTNVTYTINNAFFKKQGEGFENTYQWEEIHRVKETPKFYLIFSEKMQAHVIDKAQLDPWQTEDIKEIFDSLKSKVKVSLK
ncbi:YcxB family protein [Flavobacterium psychrotrophum]|uniref:YcxB family protein n=1 Tax=Flavobacterium psychrotrophum TaxID=2294119 RepID=UPI000E316260|nr:YcxB family protein [Flavobacterium psychrotrophum]